MSGLERYELGELLGEGAFGRTHAAQDRESGRQVAVKELTLKGLPDWKPVELLEREARVLRAIDHAGVPRFVDAFEAQQGGEPRLYVVTERVEGDTLGEKIRRGDRWDATAARRLLEDLLDTLAYLHGLSPPVIHRDVKPDNIIIRPDGRAVLVDFGAVRDLAAGPSSGQTVLGTPGYMAPEQALGQSDARSDLYGVGATVIHALTHRHPTEIPRDGMRMRFADLLGVEGPVVQVLERLVVPEPGQRFASANAALDVLMGRASAESPALSAKAGAPASTALAIRELPTALATPARPRQITRALEHRFRGPAALRNSGPKAGIAMAALVAPLVLLSVIVPALTAAAPLMVIVALGGMLGWGVSQTQKLRRIYESGPAVRGRVTGMRQIGQGAPYVDYVYEVGGEEYRGSLWARDLMAANNLQRNDPLMVFYDPDMPSRHVGVLADDLPALGD